VTAFNFFQRSHDALIRVYGEAGNVMRRTSRRAILKSGDVANRPLKLNKRSRVFIRTHNETLSVAPIRVPRLQLHILGPL
jgi:hypothetical protein